MPKFENQKLKLFRLLEIMMSRTDRECGIDMSGIISALAEYGISAERKSIYSDFECLADLGFEVIKMQGTKPTQYTLAQRYFEHAELKMLVDAIEASKFIPKTKCRAIVKKLELFAGPSGARDLSRKVYVDDRAENRTLLYSVDAIHSAIASSHLISFRYFRYNVDKKKEYRHDGALYRVSPLSLVWNDENYYLIAYDENSSEVKNFRVDRMDKVSELDEPRSKAALKTEIDPGTYTRRVFGMYGGTEALVTLECADSLAGVIIDRFGKNLHFEMDDGVFRTRINVTVSPNFFAWVAGFGSEMRILAPEKVKEQFVLHIQKALDGYK
jgi:predicted DNA-binding transcriptional regulator YafY